MKKPTPFKDAFDSVKYSIPVMVSCDQVRPLFKRADAEIAALHAETARLQAEVTRLRACVHVEAEETAERSVNGPEVNTRVGGCAVKDQTPEWTAEVISGFTTCAGVFERVVIKSPGSEELFSSRPIHGREQPEYTCPEMSANARLIQAQADEDLRRALNAARRIVDLLNADDLAAAKTEAAP